MRFPVKLEKLPDGRIQAFCQGALINQCRVVGETRQGVLEEIRDEIRYRLEMCPCSSVEDDHVQLEVISEE